MRDLILVSQVCPLNPAGIRRGYSQQRELLPFLGHQGSRELGIELVVLTFLSRLNGDKGTVVGSPALATKDVHFTVTTEEAKGGFHCEFMEGSSRAEYSSPIHLYLCLWSPQSGHMPHCSPLAHISSLGRWKGYFQIMR